MRDKRRRWSWRVAIGLAILVGLCIIGFDPHLVTHYTPFQTQSIDMKTYDTPPFPPSASHWFGSDEQGRDIFTQIVYGIIPTLRDATILVVLTLAVSLLVAVIQGMFNVRLALFDRVGYVTQIFPPVLLMLLILESQPVYFSHYGAYWYYGIIGLLEMARLIPVMEGDIRLVYHKPFIDSARVSGGSQWWIFRKHVLRWMRPYLVEYVPSQYARVLAVMGELGYFGVTSNKAILHTQDGVIFTTTQLDLPTLLSQGGHHWFQVPGGVFFPTLVLCLMIVCFRIVAAGVGSVTTIDRAQHWPWKEGFWARRRLARRRASFGQSVRAGSR